MGNFRSIVVLQLFDKRQELLVGRFFTVAGLSVQRRELRLSRRELLDLGGSISFQYTIAGIDDRIGKAGPRLNGLRPIEHFLNEGDEVARPQAGLGQIGVAGVVLRLVGYETGSKFAPG